MKKKGYRYTSPPDAADAVSEEAAGRKETATAVADVDCKKDVGLLDARHDVESGIQEKELISEREEALVAEKKHLTASLHAAAKALENSR
ncbi:hypothetical protein [Streptomyces monomycini]|uniref:hypothetical protein n=1 Tax=Streptomyces monomycini TaxID=371720 RepID=UPI0012FEA5D5|nr:hypothetical protein [Streptomyces monomycini]